MDKKGWDRCRECVPRRYKWELQATKKKSKKGRAIGGMLVGVRREINWKESRKGEMV